MNEFEKVLREILKTAKIKVNKLLLDESQIADILSKLNDFFYHEFYGNNRKFISKYHKFWEENHEKIIDAKINENSCRKISKILEHIFSKKSFPVSGDIKGLNPNQIANARYFTIVQDFKIRFRIDPYSLVKQKPYLFDAKEILNDFPNKVDELLNHLGAKSQTDKRHKFAKLCAELLIEKYNGDAFNIGKTHNYDAKEIIDVLVNNPDKKFLLQLGFSVKKATIFIRDMVDFGVWKIKNPEILDLPSDSNTMKVALRTGIIRTRVPLLTSYLDVYCFQYGLIDKKCREAWRKVWEFWGEIHNNHRLPSPASFDFLIYRVGQNWNKPDKMPEVKLFRKICPKDTKNLNPPKSISVFGATGWESGRIKEKTSGGGGIMG
jgi:hypothetical protein